MPSYNGKQKIKNPHEGGASPCSSIGGKLASHNNPVFTHKAPALNKSPLKITMEDVAPSTPPQSAGLWEHRQHAGDGGNLSWDYTVESYVQKQLFISYQQVTGPVLKTKGCVRGSLKGSLVIGVVGVSAN